VLMQVELCIVVHSKLVHSKHATLLPILHVRKLHILHAIVLAAAPAVVCTGQRRASGFATIKYYAVFAMGLIPAEPVLWFAAKTTSISYDWSHVVWNTKLSVD
jgi:hypothetical protein